MNQQPEIAALRSALIAVMNATGMNETMPHPDLGRCARCGDKTIVPRVATCRKCAKRMAEDALALRFGTLQNEEQLEAELDEGDRIAAALVDHVTRMGASSVYIPVRNRAEESVIAVFSRHDWESFCDILGVPNPFK